MWSDVSARGGLVVWEDVVDDNVVIGVVLRHVSFRALPGSCEVSLEILAYEAGVFFDLAGEIWIVH